MKSSINSKQVNIYNLNLNTKNIYKEKEKHKLFWSEGEIMKLKDRMFASRIRTKNFSRRFREENSNIIIFASFY